MHEPLFQIKGLEALGEAAAGVVVKDGTSTLTLDLSSAHLHVLLRSVPCLSKKSRCLFTVLPHFYRFFSHCMGYVVVAVVATAAAVVASVALPGSEHRLRRTHLRDTDFHVIAVAVRAGLPVVAAVAVVAERRLELIEALRTSV